MKVINILVMENAKESSKYNISLICLILHFTYKMFKYSNTLNILNIILLQIL